MTSNTFMFDFDLDVQLDKIAHAAEYEDLYQENLEEKKRKEIQAEDYEDDNDNN